MKLKTCLYSLLAMTFIFCSCAEAKTEAPSTSPKAGIADVATYLEKFKYELVQEWPNNRTLNIVFHGHSVPTGYGATPFVNTLGAYPHQVLAGIKENYTSAVVNVITTSIGGEQAEQGQLRFEKEVLPHRPDVLFIDYALNDRAIGVSRAEVAWRKMIQSALANKVKVILMTPTPDLTESILDSAAPLQEYADMIRKLAREYHVGLVDSYKAFLDIAKSGEKLETYMAQTNHPNTRGHSVVAAEILKWFTSAK